MKVFHCDHCRHLVFFENVRCVNCDHTLAFLPDLGVIGSLDPADDGTWVTPIPRAEGRAYRLCANYVERNVCNWAVPADDPNPLCGRAGSPASSRTCRPRATTRRGTSWRSPSGGWSTPSRPQAAGREQDRGLPTGGWRSSSWPTRPTRSAPPVLTGHANGVITINVAEADDAERERRRLQMHEPYRTLLGHFRHESGHYYWDRLVEGLDPARRLPRAVRGRAGGLRRRRCNGTTTSGPRRTGRSSSSAPTPAPTRGRTGPRRGPTTCT